MSELTPGVTQIINPEPPATPEAAAAAMKALDESPDFQKRVAARDPAAFVERERLWRISRGMSPERETPINMQNVLAQQNERAVRDAEQHAEIYLRQGFTDEQAYEIINARPMLLSEKAWHERELARLKMDAPFMDRMQRGDGAARLEFNKDVVARSLPSGTLADIHRWQTAHGKPLSK